MDRPRKGGKKRQTCLKVVCLGDAGVGKTSLMQRYVNKSFDTVYKATIGADFLTKEEEVDGESVSLMIWDTAGQERFRSLGSAFFRGSDACLLVFDVTNRVSFERLTSWKEEFCTQLGLCGEQGLVFVVAGNKADMADARVVSSKEANEWCSELALEIGHDVSVPYYECSAKEGINIDACFKRMARVAYENSVREMEDLGDILAKEDGDGAKGGANGNSSTCCS